MTLYEERPFLKSGLKEIYGLLIKGHKRVDGSGALLVFCTVDVKGGVTEVTASTTPSKKLTELVTTVVFNANSSHRFFGELWEMDYPFFSTCRFVTQP